MARLTRSLPYVSAIVAGYLVPAMGAPLLLDGTTDAGKGLVFGSLLVINPVITAAVGALFARRHGGTWWFPPLAAAAFVPVALVPPLNSSAFVYAALYLVTTAVGVGLGQLIRVKVISTSREPTSGPAYIPRKGETSS